jgi:hypothetical protein
MKVKKAVSKDYLISEPEGREDGEGGMECPLSLLYLRQTSSSKLTTSPLLFGYDDKGLSTWQES